MFERLSELCGGGLVHSNAICYSGYREGQSPRDQSYPSYEEIREDLLILSKNWKYLRVYDSSPHAETVLEVIRRERLDLKVMLGIDLAAEVSNPNCPWGADYDDATLARNRHYNAKQIQSLVPLANAHRESVFSVSIGNEASVEWTDHLVPVEQLVAYAKQVKAAGSQPVTFCENYVPWTNKLGPLVAEIDFISVHTYPIWEYRSIQDALEYSKQNYRAVADLYPDVPVV
ncbi:MAG: glycosyl hydrolase, partial [Myxococcota bacterium]